MSDTDDSYDPYSMIRGGMGWVGFSEAEQQAIDAETKDRQDAENARFAEVTFIAAQRGETTHTDQELLAATYKDSVRRDRKKDLNAHDSDCGCNECTLASWDRQAAGVKDDPRPEPLRKTLEREKREREAAERDTPATVADLRNLEKKQTGVIAKMKSKAHAAGIRLW